MKAYRCACSAFTVDVDVDSTGIITRAPAVAAKFVGQPFERLQMWMSKLGSFECRLIAASPVLFE